MITFGEITPNRTVSGTVTIKGLGRACRDNDKAEYVSPLLHDRWKISINTSSFYDSGPRSLGIYFQFEGTLASEGVSRGGVFGTQYELKAADQMIASGTLDTRFYTPGSDWGHRKACKMADIAKIQALKNNDECAFTYRITEHPDNTKSLSMGSDTLATSAILAWAQLFDDSATADTCFVIHHPSTSQTSPREIFAHSKLLSARLPYFTTMFKGDFNDGSGDNNNATCTEETCIGWDREADSDYDDSDESAGPKEQAEEPNADRPTETSAPAKDQSDNYRGEVASRPQKVIHIHDAAYKTYRAFLLYLYTGAVNFSPAKVVEKTEDSETTKGVSAPAKATLWNLKDTTGLDLPSTSAKSMYRLSDKLDVPELLAAAKQHVIGSLTIENVVEEISSPFSRTHPAIRKEQFAYLQKNWGEVSKTPSLRKLFADLFDHQPTSDLWLDLFKELGPKKGDKDGSDSDSSSTSD